MWKLIG